MARRFGSDRDSRSIRSTRADMIVGIDVGMTCTAVAYSYGPEWPAPKTIQRWPGKAGHELHNKVNTSVSYDVGGTVPRSWGFLCDTDNENYEYSSYFKLHIDPSYRDPSPNPPTSANARRWYLDYLGFLYNTLIAYFSNIFPRFEDKSIDFIFSVPVTWRLNVGMVPSIETLIQKAGFGQRARDTACVYLTEAEAAATHASKGMLENGDVFLVVDAGGGTTDLNVLKVVSPTHGHLELVPLSWTEGAAVGSALIDFEMRTLIQERLAISGHHGNNEGMIKRLMKDSFHTFKCNLGTPGFSIPRLVMHTSRLMEDRADGSEVVITTKELQSAFDTQLQKMFALIDQQFSLLQERYPAEKISFMVLSGGFNCSPYVQECVKRRYVTSPQSARWGAVQVLLSSEPQLAVVHGLVLARMQVRKGGPDMMAERCSPVSFGILTRELYDPEKHQGETIVQDPYDNKRWAEGQINWILKQGQMVRPDYGVSERYSTKIAMGQEALPWKTTIITSGLPAGDLPRSLRHPGARAVCKLETVLDVRDMKRKNRHWWNRKEEYNRAEFIVRMIVDTGVRFEVWSLDGRIGSKSSEEITVQWDSLEPRSTSVNPAELQAIDISQGRNYAAELPGDPLTY